MSLSYHKVVQTGSTEHAVVEKLVKTVSLSELDETIILVTKTDDWCVNFIRHKKRETYHHKNKYLVNVTDVAECQLRKEHQIKEPVAISPENYGTHRTECEVMSIIFIKGCCPTRVFFSSTTAHGSVPLVMMWGYHLSSPSPYSWRLQLWSLRWRELFHIPGNPTTSWRIFRSSGML